MGKQLCYLGHMVFVIWDECPLWLPRFVPPQSCPYSPPLIAHGRVLMDAASFFFSFFSLFFLVGGFGPVLGWTWYFDLTMSSLQFDWFRVLKLSEKVQKCKSAKGPKGQRAKKREMKENMTERG